MNELTVPQGLNEVDALIYLARIGDKVENLTREGLWKVSQDKLWEGRFSSWAEFVESAEGLNKSQGWASKHIAIHEFYTLEGGLLPEQLEGAATESLYMARALPGSPEEKVAMARSLSRRELKETKNEHENHVHSGETYSVHRCCGMRVE